MCAMRVNSYVCSALVEEGAAAEGFISGEVLPGRGRVTVCGCGTARFIGFLLGLGPGAGKLDIVKDDDRLASRLTGVLIGPGILVIAAGDVDGGAFLELHLFAALTEVTEGLDVDVDPAGVVFGVLVVDAFADAEADNIAVLGILEGCAIVEASGDHGIGCGKT